ncbi:MAG TPA: hypothetical protein VFM05_15375 [Candidatus Saccharimonadales bacterium]|nr:hypothetical protein [Candidatus Saccharimonadales bacterium]
MSSTQHHLSLLHMLQQQLDAARVHDAAVRAQNSQGNIIHVPGTGKTISSAYEQLRNAAEYAEEHLLLQRAIKRFFNRTFAFFTKRHGNVGNVGEELIVELTQAGYLHNDEFGSETAERIRALAEEYMHTYGRLREAHVSREDAVDWVLSILSVEVEEILNPHSRITAMAFTAYQHYLQVLPKSTFAATAEEAERYEICLYIAIHQALLKSDISIVRHDMMRMYKQTPHDLSSFVQFNRMVNELYMSKFTHKLKRVVSKYGAPMRILKSLNDDRDDLPELLNDHDRFLDAYDRQTQKEYKQVNSRLNKGIIKSIIFIFITKVVIGLAIEIPYDWFIMGYIAILPLAINLLFPPLYMASLKLGLKVPSLSNAQALREYIDKALYGSEVAITPTLRDSVRTASTFSKLLYAVLFFIPFIVTLYILRLLDFNIVQTVIFFVFLSTASFFGFRLSRLIRELEIMTHQSNILSTIRDFFYLPFILVGQWLSSKYARINAVGYFLDIAIELPLKTVLRLIRQWTRFLNEKHEELY